MVDFTKDNVQGFFTDRKTVLNDIESSLAAKKASLEMAKERSETKKSWLVSQLQEALEKSLPDLPERAFERLDVLMGRYPDLAWGKVATSVKLMTQKQQSISKELEALPTTAELASCIRLSKAFIRGEEQKIMRESLSSIRSSSDLMLVTEISEQLPAELPLESVRQASWLQRLSPLMKKRQKLVKRLDAAWGRASRFHKIEALPDTPEQVVKVMEDRRYVGRELVKLIRDEQTKLGVYESQLKSADIFLSELSKCNNHVLMNDVHAGFAELLAFDDVNRSGILLDLGLHDLGTTWRSVFDTDLGLQDHLKSTEDALADIKENLDAITGFQALIESVLREVSEWSVAFEEVDEQLALLVVDNDMPLSHYPFLERASGAIPGGRFRDLESAITQLIDSNVKWLKLSGVCKEVTRKIRNFELVEDYSNLSKRRYFATMMNDSFSGIGASSPMSMSSGGYTGGCSGSSDSGSSSSSFSGGSDGGC